MNQHTPKHCFRKDVEDETKLKIHYIAVSETQDEAKESCFGGDDSRGRVQHCRTERCKNCNINRSNILGETETFMIFVFLLAKKASYILPIYFASLLLKTMRWTEKTPSG